jgi:hypothetical protein
MPWREVALRLALIGGLLGAIAYGTAVWVTAPLGLIVIAATAELAVRPYATNAVDKLLLGCGAVVTTLILVGLGLNLTPWGLTQASWSVAFAILSIGVLAWRRGLGSHVKRPAIKMRSLSVWLVSASLILAVAVVLAVTGVRHSDQQPVLAFALVSKSTNAVVVEIEATSIKGKYHIVAASKVPGARQYASALLAISAQRTAERVQERVPINIAGTWTIDLQSAGDGTVVRRLRVDVG